MNESTATRVLRLLIATFLLAILAPSIAHARWYDPEDGRWTTRDPLGYTDGLGLYEYAVSHPTNRTDPAGLFAFAAEGQRLMSQLWDYGVVQSALARLRQYYQRGPTAEQFRIRDEEEFPIPPTTPILGKLLGGSRFTYGVHVTARWHTKRCEMHVGLGLFGQVSARANIDHIVVGAVSAGAGPFGWVAGQLIDGLLDFNLRASVKGEAFWNAVWDYPGQFGFPDRGEAGFGVTPRGGLEVRTSGGASTLLGDQRIDGGIYGDFKWSWNASSIFVSQWTYRGFSGEGGIFARWQIRMRVPGLFGFGGRTRNIQGEARLSFSDLFF